ncbi:PspC domain-containing protein [Nocardiopsis suaedae]|uniref:PspC domain-containing protein n=1 Tax=Nocardiopsis suaedae TaxID=3018444 RepID=A0ABT4TTC7_9ACTN|nr:PspC domain-containing protein [Nocardiopsis suaedae]MDA2807514.1 PspC domain-containing protein [Nocardiopsis suaedae]
METAGDTTAGEATADEGLRRRPDAGVLTGVCAGLGRYTGTDPVLWRVAFCLTGLAGLVGVLLYVGAWLVMRDARGGPAMAEQLLNRRVPARAVPTLLAAALAVATALSLVGGVAWGTLVLAAPLVLGLLTAHGRGVVLQREFRALPSLLRRHAPPPPAPEPEPGPAYYNPAQPWAQAPAGPIDLAVLGGGGAPRGAAAPAPQGAPEPSDSSSEPPESSDPPRPSESSELSNPSDAPEPRQECRPRRKRARGVRLLAFAFWAAVAAAGGFMLATGEFSLAALVGPQTGPLYLGSVAVVIGLALVAGAWVGDARGLAVVGVLVAVLLVAASATDLTGLRFGEAQWRPRTVAEAQRPFELTGGTAAVDLTRMELEPGDEVAVRVKVGFGGMEVVVPQEARVRVHGTSAFGEIRVDESMRSGPRLDVRETLEPAAGGAGGGDGAAGGAPVLDVTLSSYVGDLEVRREKA